MIVTAALLLSLSAAPTAVSWQPWSPEVFAQAKAQHRLVLMDLQAVWCHWCHVMDEQTYANPAVRKLIHDHYVPVQVDQDSSPALSLRYERWGWPATVIFAADGTELVKRRGYLRPEVMASLLQEVVDDPTPGPSVVAELPLERADGAALKASTQKKAEQHFVALYDAEHGGWGHVHHMLDAEVLEYAFASAQAGDTAQEARVRQTLRATLKLLDPVWGGVYQYSDTLDWSSPHFEKLVSIQAQALRMYALGYSAWKDTELLRGAQAVHHYLQQFLKSPEGAFYVSQDADLSLKVTGHEYYAWPDAQRRAHGIPKVDHHLYSRENGWVIVALCALADATGDAEALVEAQTTARWVMAQRGLPDDGFGHGDKDARALGDTLGMAQAFFALYQSSADRMWLVQAQRALDFIERRFRDASGDGYVSALPGAGLGGVFLNPIRNPGENAELARVANLIFHATASARYRKVAESAMRYLSALGNADPDALTPLALVANAELGREPLHLTLVGPKDEPNARALYRAGLTLSSTYRLLEWLDRREGPLPHPVPPFPTLSKPAVFVCKSNACSLPLFTPERVLAAAKF